MHMVLGQSSLMIMYPTGHVSMSSNGDFEIIGNVKAAALAMFKHINGQPKCTKMVFNSSVCADFIKQPYTLKWINEFNKEPEQWKEFVEAYEGLWKLKAFI